MKKKLVLILILATLLCCSSFMSTAFAESKTSLRITFNTGISKIVMSHGTVVSNLEITEDKYIAGGISVGTPVNFTVYYASGYCSASGKSTESFSYTYYSTGTFAPEAYYALTLTLGTGIKNVIVNSKTYTSSTKFGVTPNSTVSYTVNCADGYMLTGAIASGTTTYSGSLTMSGANSLNFSAAVMPKLTVTIDKGISSYFLSAPSANNYTENRTFSYNAETSVTWRVTPKAGYAVVGATSGTINVSTSTAKLNFTTTCTLTVTVGTGIASVTVNGTRYTSSTTLQIATGSSVSWSAIAATGYTLSQSSGTVTMSSPQTLAPSATAKVYTVSLTYNPTDAEVFTAFSWKMEWVSGYSKAGNCSNYVDLTISNDGKTATVKFKADFTGAKILLTAYCTNAPSIKKSVEITCG